MTTKDRWAESYIENGIITIRVPVSVLGTALLLNPRDQSYVDVNVTNKSGFGHDVVRELNSEEEDGTTLIHLMMDKAMANAIENGSEYVEFTGNHYLR